MAALQWFLKRLYISKAPIAVCCFCPGKTGFCLEGMIWPMLLQVPEMSTLGIQGGQQLTFKLQSIHLFFLWSFDSNPAAEFREKGEVKSKLASVLHITPFFPEEKTTVISLINYSTSWKGITIILHHLPYLLQILLLFSVVALI